MSVTATPAAPATTNGAASAVTQPATPAPAKDTATGAQTPAPASAGATRGPDGKFQSANGAPAEKSEPKPPAKLKIKDREWDEEDAHREIERGRNSAKLLSEAERRMKAAEAKEKAWEERRAKAKEDLSTVLDELELTPEQEQLLLSRRLYAKHIQPGEMTPEQRELAEAKAWRAEREAKDKAEAEAKEAEAKKAILSEESKKVHAELIEAVQAGKLPNSERLIRRIMAKVVDFDSRGMVLPLEHHVALARDEIREDAAEFVEATPISDLKELLGQERFIKLQKKWNEHFLAMLKAAPQSAPVRAPIQKSPDKKDTITVAEFLARQARK